MSVNMSRIQLSFLCIMVIAIGGCKSKTQPEDKPAVKDEAPGDQLALTPPMGWNSWNVFGRNISEAVIRETADAMVSSGLKDAGYEFLVIDDLWHGGRDSVSGKLFPDPQKFPSGMKALVDYVHGKGLKFGIYSDAGTKTCGEMPGSYGY